MLWLLPDSKMSRCSPHSLLYLTVDFIAVNYKKVCFVKKKQEGCNFDISWLGWSHYESYRLPLPVSELLLQRFLFHFRLTTSMDFLTLFTDPSSCPLRKFSLANVYFKYLCNSNYLKFVLPMIIKSQKLIELNIGAENCHLLADMETFTSNCASLKYLSIFGFYDGHVSAKRLCSSKHQIFKNPTFPRIFQNLHYLSLCNCSYIGDDEIIIITAEMKNLNSLDLSKTKVANTNSFKNISKQLKMLVLHDTPLVYNDLRDLLEFPNLQHLDISHSLQVSQLYDENDEVVDGDDYLHTFFTSGKSLPFLKMLDISGNKISDVNAFQIFLQRHEKLSFLGLLGIIDRIETKIIGNLEVDSPIIHAQKYNLLQIFV